MIEINNIQYHSPYKPSNKSWFKMMVRTGSIVNKIPFDEQALGEKWDLEHKLREAEDILKEHPELEKELNLIINECEFKLMKFSKDDNRVRCECGWTGIGHELVSKDSI